MAKRAPRGIAVDPSLLTTPSLAQQLAATGAAAAAAAAKGKGLEVDALDAIELPARTGSNDAKRHCLEQRNAAIAASIADIPVERRAALYAEPILRITEVIDWAGEYTEAQCRTVQTKLQLYAIEQDALLSHQRQLQTKALSAQAEAQRKRQRKEARKAAGAPEPSHGASKPKPSLPVPIPLRSFATQTWQEGTAPSRSRSPVRAAAAAAASSRSSNKRKSSGRAARKASASPDRDAGDATATAAEPEEERAAIASGNTRSGSSTEGQGSFLQGCKPVGPSGPRHRVSDPVRPLAGHILRPGRPAPAGP